MTELFSQRIHFTIGWLAISASFIILEAIAIFGATERATLSNHVRSFLSAQPMWVTYAAWVLMLWLTAHFLLDLRK